MLRPTTTTHTARQPHRGQGDGCSSAAAAGRRYPSAAWRRRPWIETVGGSSFIMKLRIRHLVKEKKSSVCCLPRGRASFLPRWTNSSTFRSPQHPLVRWSARRALRSRGDTGRFERGLVSRRAREAEKRDSEVRFSVRPCLPELELSALSFILRPSSVPLEYRGMNARHIESRYFIATTTRHSLTLPPGTSRSLCPRSLEPAEDKDRAST